MKHLSRFVLSLIAFAFVFLTGCEEFQTTGLSSTLATGNRTSAASNTAPTEALTKHDIALRFLTAFIRLDRNMAARYATPEALSKLNWNMSHHGNIPYYDDKMLLQFNGGWARVYFQDIGGTYRIIDFDVHPRRR